MRTLREVSCGETVTVKKLSGEGPVKRRIMDMGMAVAAVTGLIAKENVVATFGMLFGFAEVAEDGVEVWGCLAAVMTPIAAFGFLTFNLLCAPCFAAMGAIKREMNNAK